MLTKQSTALSTTVVQETDTEKKRQEVLKKMSAPLRSVADKVVEGLTSMRATLALRLWNLGAILRKIRDKPDKYGSNSIGLLEDYIGIELPESKSYVQKAIHLNTWVDAKKLQEIMSLRTKKHNKPLSWQHIERLLTIPDTKKRDELIENIVDNDLTVDELDYEISPLRLTNGNGAPGGKQAGGRPRLIPENPIGRINQINKVVGAIVRDYRLFWVDKFSGVDRLAKDVPADKINSNLIELVDTTISSLSEAEECCRNTKLKLTDSRKTLSERMLKQAKAKSASEVVQMLQKKA